MILFLRMTHLLHPILSGESKPFPTSRQRWPTPDRLPGYSAWLDCLPWIARQNKLPSNTIAKHGFANSP